MGFERGPVFGFRGFFWGSGFCFLFGFYGEALDLRLRHTCFRHCFLFEGLGFKGRLSHPRIVIFLHDNKGFHVGQNILIRPNIVFVYESRKNILALFLVMESSLLLSSNYVGSFERDEVG